MLNNWYHFASWRSLIEDTINRYGKPRKIIRPYSHLPCVYLYYDDDFIIRLTCR